MKVSGGYLPLDHAVYGPSPCTCLKSRRILYATDFSGYAWLYSKPGVTLSDVIFPRQNIAFAPLPGHRSFAGPCPERSRLDQDDNLGRSALIQDVFVQHLS